ncbi:plexin-A4-like isoform X3 [Rhopilema esculentum]|uniref:plexin-A4-like isoform X3 n=1 Tax=Rhopilema esculentum TaxID=499914 RepID=UPI0031D5097B
MDFHSLQMAASVFILIMISFKLDTFHAYKFEADTDLNNMAFQGNEVFIGATNYIHRLNSNLVQLNSKKTGPVNDSRHCITPNEHCKDLKLTDNRNTVLLIYKKSDSLTSKTITRLFTCGSIYQGVCQLRDIKNMDSVLNGSAAVAANDANSSTVAFLGQDKSGNNMLHIAVTHNKRIDFMTLPAVSIRQLDGLGERYFLRPYNKNYIEVKRDYVIDYVSGFLLEKFAFFTSVQPVQYGGGASNVYESKIVRYCLEVPEFYSYTEIPLSCKDSAGTQYNILISGMLIKATGKTAQMLNVSEGDNVYIGVFSKSAATGKAQTDKNAVCIFTIKDANKAFDDNIKMCVLHGEPIDGGLKWMKTYQPGVLCKSRQSTGGALDLSCENFRYVRDFKQGGHIPLNNTHSFVVPGKLTAIKAYPHARGLAVFLGTSKGMLNEYAVFTGMKTHLYGYEVVVNNEPIRKMDIDPAYQGLYAMTRRQVSKYSIQNCGKRLSCVDCLAGPGCGWCTLEKKCSIKSECIYSQRPLYFVDDSVDSCPSVLSFKHDPAAISVREQAKVYWKIKNMPVLQDGRTYKCSFGSANVTTVVSGDEYSCTTPKFGEIPEIVDARSTAVKVILRSPEKDIALFHNSVTFFNCEQIKSCLECTRFKYTCNWCSSSLTCLDRLSSCGNYIAHAGPEQAIAFSQCPLITGMKTSFVSDSVDREIRIEGKNLPAPTGLFNYECLVRIEDQELKTIGRLESKTSLVCTKRIYKYVRNTANYTTVVLIRFGGKDLDVIKDTRVTFYKCEVERHSCGICLNAPKAWQCGWCNQKTCTVADACSATKDWANATCPRPPEIKQFSPLSGAISGNTEVKIEGRDLGTIKADIVNVTIAGRRCQLLPDLYVVSKTVYCKTEKIPAPRNGTVQMFVKFGQRIIPVSSKTQFMYKKPTILRFEPTKGPCSGGTKFTVFGSDLHVGGAVNVTVAGNLCNGNLRRFPSKIVCTISSRCSKRRRRAIDSVKVSFDGQNVPLSIDAVFSVQPDPIVKSVNTHKLRTDNNQALETFVSGGQVFIVKGERFDLIQHPRIKFLVYPQMLPAYGPCNITLPTRLDCIAPNITGITGEINNASVIVQLGFAMQRVKSVESIENITVRGDPVFEKFGIKDLRRRNLFLKGWNLDLLGNEDVNVTVAGLPCVVQNIRETLFCISPEEEKLEKIKQSQKALVKVVIGQGGLEQTLGFIRYVKSPVEAKPFPWLYVYITAPIAAGLIVVIIVLIILYFQRKKKEKKYQKVYKTRLENLESRYARECKEAFAELQTEMTDLTTDMSSTIPYLEFENYAMRSLFPGIDTHPIMDRDCNKSDTWKKCMSSLCDLLKEKEFLLIFIKTLESQQSFAMRDRCKVASLLMVALQDDLKYVTDILQELLADLIHKSVDSGRAKLLLRRTESVAEKLLTNWLSYTLHEFLQQRVGEPLFRLFTAIVSLLDKEPVDAIACEARNSLSEDRLLRQKVDFTTITAHVEYEKGDMIQVQLLNCDSVNQAKEKILNAIYKNVAFSQRPNKDSLVLAYQTPAGGEKILHQEDSTCEIDGEWKRINTLDHFLIPDGCQLKLMAFTVFSDGTGTPGRFDVFHDSSLPNVNFAPTHSSTPMLNNHSNSDDCYRLWHLVKTSDYPIEHKEDVRQNKMMAEVYLTRLLKTKGTLQNFVDDLFGSVFSVTSRNITIPPAMKFLFDFLDKQAGLLNISDNEVLHTWKNNCLPLKFWINIIKNPNFVFDIHKTSIVDSCLSVVAQLFMDSCSPEEHRLGKDSPSNKLLYAKEIPDYKKKVARFYSEVKLLPPATDKELIESLSDISDKYGDAFNHYNAAIELLSYAVKYKVKIMDTLESEDLEEYAKKLQEIMETLPDD